MAETIETMAQGTFVVACPHNSRVNITLMDGEKLVGCPALNKNDRRGCQVRPDVVMVSDSGICSS